MELMVESRPEVGHTGKVYQEQARGRVHPEPVLPRDRFTDRAGTTCWGSVIHDAGMYRMWYQPWPGDWDGANCCLVGYAESDDGITWRKPNLGLQSYGPESATNLTDLGLHSPSVYIDPTAPPEARYRATGHASNKGLGLNMARGAKGYYSAHSADGLHWTLDQSAPGAAGADTIKSIWHPGRGRGMVAFKRFVNFRGIPRRSIYTADLTDGRWSDPVLALAPDDFDDLAAQARGFVSGDYYAMAMMPAGKQGTVAFVEQFRHALPRLPGSDYGIFGVVDATLAYQNGPGDRWLHASARRDFLSHQAGTYYAGGFYLSSTPVAVGDEMRLYLSGASQTHGWYVNPDRSINEARKRQLIEQGMFSISFASFTRDRLFGLRSDPEGVVHLTLQSEARQVRLRLNCETATGGSVRVAIPGVDGRELEQAVPITGDLLDATAAWTGGDLMAVPADGSLRVELHLDSATAWAWDLEEA